MAPGPLVYIVTGVTHVISSIAEARHAQILASGTSAPDFTLRVTPDQNLSLQDLAGRPVILAFYPADWSPVCGDQMALYNEVLPEFHEAGAELLGISVDRTLGVMRHSPRTVICTSLCSRTSTLRGKVASSYGAYRKAEGVCERALFVIDRQGVIFWSYRSPIRAPTAFSMRWRNSQRW